MAERTNIEWADSTFNPWIGCTKVSPACDHCYAENLMDHRFKRVQWGLGRPRAQTKQMSKPLNWNQQAFVECPSCGWRGDWAKADERQGRCPHCCHLPELFKPARQRVFCASLSDWLDHEVPVDWLIDLLTLVRKTPNLDWLLLSKRIGNWRGRLELVLFDLVRDIGRTMDRQHTLEWVQEWLEGDAPKNVWIGATVVNQIEADRDIPKLLRVPAHIRFLSIEPMLGAVEVFSAQTGELLHVSGNEYDPGRLDWIICGGESGKNARPMHPYWVRGLRDQCASADVPFLFKQWGEWVPAGCCDKGTPIASTALLAPDGQIKEGSIEVFCDDAFMYRVGKKAAGRLFNGREHNGLPGAQ
ncbi:phage Gp37/Gp68 family protein [Sinimarinibacterium sp. NLF-5-8]|uniref:phage Gp37/Gp68 family protein n=1 Tax=Sinimarinibacterium sp. NLF-5-8 TaxID=2698684 RepID=UPI00137BFDEA|nr:phage Gp37/Gp68 family protein [Sinimarinibacterium sp. NLF-5-8]QHS09127.1 phage Gp37/Gp68 family protein [Sinimarinibacterium sp. NLF-5-8]